MLKLHIFLRDCNECVCFSESGAQHTPAGHREGLQQLVVRQPNVPNPVRIKCSLLSCLLLNLITFAIKKNTDILSESFRWKENRDCKKIQQQRGLAVACNNISTSHNGIIMYSLFSYIPLAIAAIKIYIQCTTTKKTQNT